MTEYFDIAVYILAVFGSICTFIIICAFVSVWIENWKGKNEMAEYNEKRVKQLQSELTELRCKPYKKNKK